MHDKSHQDIIASLNDRLLRLERRSRRLAWLAATAAASAIAIAVAAGAIPDQVPDQIEAKKFVLLSADGKVIAELGADPFRDHPHLLMYDKQGDLRFAAGTEGLSISQRFEDRQVTTTGRILLRREADGQSSLLFRDDQGRSRLQVGLTKDNTPVLQIWDKNLATRIKLELDQKSDASYVSIRDGHEARIVLGLTSDNAGAVSLTNPKGGEAMTIEGSSPAGSGRIEIYDDQGQRRVLLKGDDVVPAALNFFDPGGKLLVAPAQR